MTMIGSPACPLGRLEGQARGGGEGEGRCRLSSPPPKGATPCDRPPRGAILIPRPLGIGIYTAIFAATPWGDGSRRSGTDLHRCRSYLLIRGRSRPQSLVAQGLWIRHPLVPSEGRHSRSVPSSCQ